jgi:DNA (cytosine-5)-methyltransferase 1
MGKYRLLIEKHDIWERSHSLGDHSTFNFVDVFAGCGGLSLGLKQSGWNGLFAIEKNANAFETLDHNFRDGARFGFEWPTAIERQPWDIAELIEQRGAALQAMAHRVDLMAGGPPCQGFSHAGRRRADDPRNRLFEDYLRLVDILQPKLVLIENVRGFKSDFGDAGSGEIRNFAATLIERLGHQYDITSKILVASNFGVPQIRPRFFVIGAKKSLSKSREIESFFADLEAAAVSFLTGQGLTQKQSAHDALSDLEVNRNGFAQSVESPGFNAIKYGKPRTAFQRLMHKNCGKTLSDTRLARHRPEIRDRFEQIIKACHEHGRLNMTLSAEMRETFNIKKLAIRVMDRFQPAPTITSLPDDLLHYSEPRTLTVRENARLQSFPDWFEFKGKYTTGGLRRRYEVPRFTQVANAVPPLLAQQLGLALKRILAESDYCGVDHRARTSENDPVIA